MTINYEVKDGMGVVVYNHTTEYEKATMVIKAIKDYGYRIDTIEFRDISDGTRKGLAEARFKVGSKEEYNKVADVYSMEKIKCEKIQEARDIISKDLAGLTNQCLANILRSIVFNKGNQINWIAAYDEIIKQCPELRRVY